MNNLSKNDISDVLLLLQQTKGDIEAFQENLTKEFLNNFNIGNLQAVDYYHKTYELSEKALSFVQKRIRVCVAMINNKVRNDERIDANEETLKE